MKRCDIAIGLAIVVAGCDGTTTAPTLLPQKPVTNFFVLSGRIVDTEGAAVAGARVLITTDSTIQTTMSGDDGAYRFDNVRGHISLRVSKDGFLEEPPLIIYVDRDKTLNVPLRRVQEGLMLVPGTPLHATVQGPPCDPVRWDATALCERVYFTPPQSNAYDIVLTWNGPSELDMLVDESLYFTGPGEIRSLLLGTAGVRHEIRIHSYYLPQTFTLTATSRSGYVP